MEEDRNGFFIEENFEAALISTVPGIKSGGHQLSGHL